MIKHIPLDQNILHAALDEIDKGKCLLLFPTRRCKLIAQKMYQPDWDFSEHKFLTMDEWKDTLFLVNKPILKEEKRTLVLFLLLTKTEKDFFRIHSYKQSIAFSHNFFRFWEEIKEELIESSKIDKILEIKQTAGDWQLNTWRYLQQIADKYRSYLDDIGFTDHIFVRDLENLRTENPFSKIIVVNQFYFTELEKKLLKIFKDRVLILSQIPQSCLNQETLATSSTFQAEHIKQFISHKLILYTAPDQTEMIAQLAMELAKVEKADIIDFQFEKQSYSHLLSAEIFAKPVDLYFSNSRFYRFFKVISEILSSIIWKGKPFLISVESLLSLSAKDDLLTYFIPNNTDREAFRTHLFELIDNDYKYIDQDYYWYRHKEFSASIESIFLFLKDLMKNRSSQDLLDYIVTKIDLEYLLTDFNNKTDVSEVLIASLADFNSIEEIQLITNWQNVFPHNSEVNLLQLLLDYLKPKKLKLEDTNQNKPYKITSLQDSRNLEFNDLFILNVVEGVLPDRKHKQFLFSENQRKELGLKTYDDITLRDKYYFFRLLCNCKKVIAFSRYNLEEDIEVSSFIEELKLDDLVEETDTETNIDLHKQLFNRLLPKKLPKVPKNIELPDNFFIFPFRKQDFLKNNYNLSFYKWEKLKNNSFEYYLEFVAELKKREIEIADDFSSKLIGKITHEVLDLVWKRLIDVYHSASFKHDFVNNTKLYIEQALDHFLKYNRDFRYLSSHNFSQIYFHQIFIPLLADGIENFFYRLHNDLQLSDKIIKVFPETEESLGNLFFKIDDFDVYLRGRPDLRIHTEESKYIFDFKTGSSSTAKLTLYSQQLQFYEYICYLIDSPDSGTEINSFLFFVEQKNMKLLKKRIDLKNEMWRVLQEIMSNGFGLADKPDKYETKEITRRDLLDRRKITS
ncbi:MAG: PD-(D/E)XK nuclease family protein [Candidatus Cloacimonetes bacterium]|nr:PD-(D/E)XK nuclease family protein [Candidatus Cloacimonadota bacterium]